MIATTKKKRRVKIQRSYKIKVVSAEGKSWVEERCWKCGKVLQKHPNTKLYVNITQVQCPNCKAFNLIEVED